MILKTKTKIVIKIRTNYLEILIAKINNEMARVQNGFKCSRFSLEVFSLFDNSGFSLQLCESARHTRRNGANFRNTVISSVQWCMVLGSQTTQLGL